MPRDYQERRTGVNSQIVPLGRAHRAIDKAQAKAGEMPRTPNASRPAQGCRNWRSLWSARYARAFGDEAHLPQARRKTLSMVLSPGTRFVTTLLTGVGRNVTRVACRPNYTTGAAG